MRDRWSHLPGLGRLQRLLGPSQWQALLFCVLIAACSQIPGWSFLLFPELAALSTTVLREPAGPWASRPGQLIVLPVVTGCCGVWITRSIADPGVAVLVAVAAAALVLRLARSALVPAISAAALPAILQIRSWAYPAQIGIGLVALVGVLRLLRRGRDRSVADSPAGLIWSDVQPAKTPLGRWSDLLRWFMLLVLLHLIARITGLRDLLVPPLIVMAYEALVAPSHCDWVGRAWILPLVCGVAALAGVLAAWLLPWPALAAALSLTLCLVLLNRCRLRLPPLLALGLLPLVMPAPDLRLVPAVMLAAVLVVLSRRLPGSAERMPPPQAAVPGRSRGHR